MPEPRWQAAIFDVDGTLVDSREAVIEAVATGFREVLTRHGHPGVEADAAQLLAGLGLPADEYYLALLPQEYHALAAEVKEASTHHEVAAMADGHGRLFGGVLETLTELRERGTKLACISNAQEPYFRACLRYLGIDPLLEHSECYEELPPPRDAERAAQESTKVRLLRRALEALGSDPARTLMVGDRAADVEAARTHGCVGVGMLHGFGSREELSAAKYHLVGFPGLLDL